MSPTADPSGPLVPEAGATTVSVCMASYDGAAWIEEMLTSVLAQLGPDDEVVVVDDVSTDDTMARVESMDDPRIRLHCNEVNLGSVRTFERAMGLSRGRVVLLADQDDVWVPGRLDAMVAALRDHGVVATSVAVLGDPLEPPRWPLRARDSGRRLLNLALVLVGTRWYFGCAMGVRRDVLEIALPVPTFVHESHDLWIGVVGNVLGQMTHLERPSVQRRLHDANQTPLGWRSLPTILRSRWMLARAVVVAVRRARAARVRSAPAVGQRRV